MSQRIKSLSSTRGVWVRECVLCKIIGAPQGELYGERNSLSCVIEWLKKGYCGNKKEGDCITLGVCLDLSREHNEHGIFYQVYGGSELFSNGSDFQMGGNTNAKPCWFLSGPKLLDLDIQTSIVVS